MADKYLKVNNDGVVAEEEGLVASTGAPDAGKIPALDASGKLDTTVLPAGVGPQTKMIAASENMTAPCIVNVHNSSGEKVRYADASAASASKKGVGFILANATTPNPVAVYFEGEISGLAGLTPGATYFLSDSTPGGLVDTPVTTAGRILQKIGVATSATSLDFEPSDPIIRA